MSISTLHRQAQAADALLDACPLGRSSHVVVLGAAQIELLAGLARRGVDRAACVSAATRRCAFDGVPDLVILPDGGDPDALMRDLSGLNRLPVGVLLAIRIARRFPPPRRQTFQDHLRRVGFRLDGTARLLADGASLHFARKIDRHPAVKAA